MSVTIHNLLSIDLFKDAKIAAGSSGLNNEIGRINFIDCPFPDDIRSSGLINKGDLFINSFYIAGDDEDMLFDFINAYIDCKCSGTFIITEYIKKLPQKIEDLCNMHNFPVVFIDPDIPYAEIIKTTMEMILSDKSETIFEMKIERILSNNVSKKTIIDTAHEIIKNFRSNYVSLYVSPDDFSGVKKQMSVATIKNINAIEPVTYKKGMFLIINLDKLSLLPSYIEQSESILKNFFSRYNIGISNTFNEVENFNICLRQSLLSYEISKILEGNTVYYKDISLYKILYPLKNSDVLMDFYSDVIEPLTKDVSNDKNELINTIEAYLNCDGDFKKTAALINQHENTVRYRISKAKRLLNLENNNFKFIEQVSIALKIKNILRL
ncbi:MULTISPECIES: PucR family transcriptional regulator [unclassified Sedimentibacter]|uniref:PucR family transcriptional regulator n=1 Tax=unclassified Sedimentibacter TaxID=2649220 RepID=UPI0027E064D3|nr:PucR family transcriptional regulator [Sedimentibacter sp. MB35-C1]WMJ76451.1 PucR family transcriptional regulator ligand-binding domain-containing protein [Sedimentibacter sp. MB35-C1]